MTLQQITVSLFYSLNLFTIITNSSLTSLAINYNQKHSPQVTTPTIELTSGLTSASWSPRRPLVWPTLDSVSRSYPIPNNHHQRRRSTTLISLATRSTCHRDENSPRVNPGKGVTCFAKVAATLRPRGFGTGDSSPVYPSPGCLGTQNEITSRGSSRWKKRLPRLGNRRSSDSSNRAGTARILGYEAFCTVV